MDQKLFRTLETIRGREKRSNFIEYLIIEGLKTHSVQNKQQTLTPTIISPAPKKKESIG
jgi:metal-responsive CopG/Arc/MetJ family transcriptional regulator